MAADAELWHTPAGDAFATITVDEHLEHHRLRTRAFRQWLARRYYRAEDTAPGSQALQDALTVLEGKAMFDGDEHPVYTRLAEHHGAIYLDLVNSAWQAVEITATGWRVVDHSPVRFRRAKAMLALPVPEPGGSIDQLRSFINVSDYDWPLVVAWLIAALRPIGPYPVLCLHGEQGSGKSTQMVFLRALSDPNSAPLRSEPREPRDLMIAANNGWVVALDNLSYLHPWLSDCLCRLSTGGGFSTRTLYSDDEETIFDAKRPVLLGGIEELATRGDLLDRSIVISLPRIEEEERREEKKLLAEFRRAQPRILGAFLDAVAAGIANVDGVHLDRLPRMADFAIWIAAAEPALPWPSGTFMDAYDGNRSHANDMALEASPVAKLVIDLAGTATELMYELENHADDRTKRRKDWPSSPRVLGGMLRRLAPNLRAAGVGIEFGKEGRGRGKRRVISIGIGPESIVPTVPDPGFSGESGGDGGANAAGGDDSGAQTGVDVNPSGATPGTVGDGGDAKMRPRSNPPHDTTGQWEEGEI